jgi:hypothetical protein
VPAPLSNPPYVLVPTAFRFAALAALAGRAPLGGRREVVLATYMAARLAQDVLADRGLSQPTRLERAAQGRTWLANIALPASVRPALAKLVDVSAASAADAAAAVRVVMAVTTPFLDAKAQGELEQLAAALETEPAAI